MCYWLFTLILYLHLMCSTPPLAAQSPPASPAQTFTVAQAVREALEKNLTLIAERSNINVAEARIITARLRPNPVLTLNPHSADLGVRAGCLRKPFVGPPFVFIP